MNCSSVQSSDGTRPSSRHFLLVALVLSPAGDVLNVAVAVVSVDGELLLVVARQDAVIGIDADLRHLRIARRAERRAGRDPAANEAIFVGRGVHAFAAAVS